MKTHFETETCSRCHGSGKYSYCQMYADRCFKCKGNKVVLTKRGAAARAYLEDISSIDASLVVVGDKIATTGITNAGASYGYIGEVTDIKHREAIRTAVRTKRENGYVDVSYKTEFSKVEGFNVLASSGGSVEFGGEAGITVEKFNEYLFTVVSKYGSKSMTITGKVRVYRANNAELIAKALEYQASLTKLGKPKKVKL